MRVNVLGKLPDNSWMVNWSSTSALLSTWVLLRVTYLRCGGGAAWYWLALVAPSPLWYPAWIVASYLDAPQSNCNQTDCILDRSPLNTKTHPTSSPQAVSGVLGFLERSPPSPLSQNSNPHMSPLYTLVHCPVVGLKQKSSPNRASNSFCKQQTRPNSDWATRQIDKIWLFERPTKLLQKCLKVSSPTFFLIPLLRCATK